MPLPFPTRRDQRFAIHMLPHPLLRQMFSASANAESLSSGLPTASKASPSPRKLRASALDIDKRTDIYIFLVCMIL
jgi:hypothetical protein